MSLKQSFSELTEKLDRLREEFLLLKGLGVDDAPEDLAAALHDAFTDAIEDIIGCVNKASDAAHHSDQSLAGGIDLNGVVEGLVRCNESWNRASLRYWSGLNSYERVSTLMDLGRARGGEWAAWAKGVEAGLNKCSGPMLDLDRAIFECWREIGEAVLVAAAFGSSGARRNK